MDIRERLELEERPIIDALARVGVSICSVSQLNNADPLSREAVEVILSWLEEDIHPNIADLMVHALSKVKLRYDGKALTALFDRTSSESVKWAIALTLSKGRAKNVTAWLQNAVLEPAGGNARQMLLKAASHYLDSSTANEIAIGLFDLFPGHAAEALGRTGGRPEMNFLDGQVLRHKGWEQKAIIKALKRISERLEA